MTRDGFSPTIDCENKRETGEHMTDFKERYCKARRAVIARDFKRLNDMKFLC